MYKLSNLAAKDFEQIFEYTLLNFGIKQADVYTDSIN
ncbi:plasmid stabilization protein, partial [Vibrio parahaemolyticus]